MERSRPEAEDQPAPMLDCEQWESMLADKMDGTLAPELEASFQEHGLRCPHCAALLGQAEQGRQWLKLLEEHAPATPADLLSRILAKTQGAGRETDYALGRGVPAGGAAPLQGTAVLGRWAMPFVSPAGMQSASRAHSARMLMTAAMAFFSVALTLSVAGVGFNSVHAAELRPQVVQASVFRSFYGTKKQVVSFYENLRLVYEVESRMSETRKSEAPDQSPDQAKPGSTQKPGGKTQASPDPGSPSFHPPVPTSLGGGAAAGDTRQRAAEPPGKEVQKAEPVLHGWPALVGYSRFSMPAPRLLAIRACSLVTSGSEHRRGTERKRI